LPNKIPLVVVAGGGIAGIACALRVLDLAREKNFPLDLLLLESSQRLGGVIQTLERDGCRLELGPDALFTEKPWGLDFLRRIGLENEIVGANPEYRKSFIARGGKLLPVPEGFYLLAPSRIFPLLLSPVFSLKGKLRALGDLFIPRKDSDGDESLESFVLRRFGKEVLERMAEPMAGGIYSSDPKDLSLQATFPAFLELERKYGSVIRGLAVQARLSPSREPSRGPR
jgi:oxygen-dependent protoporphyrinogen oxidase